MGKTHGPHGWCLEQVQSKPRGGGAVQEGCACDFPHYSSLLEPSQRSSTFPLVGGLVAPSSILCVLFHVFVFFSEG